MDLDTTIYWWVMRRGSVGKPMLPSRLVVTTPRELLRRWKWKPTHPERMHLSDWYGLTQAETIGLSSPYGNSHRIRVVQRARLIARERGIPHLDVVDGTSTTS